MGYLLMFSQKLHNISRKNQLNYEAVSIQNRQQQLTSQITSIQQLLDAQPQDSPNIGYLTGYKEMLTIMNNNLDTRLAYVQTQLQAVDANQKNVDAALQEAIQNSAPKYVGC